MLALGSASGLQTNKRLVALESLVATSRTILVVLTALHEEFCTLWTLNLLRCPTEKITHPSGFGRSQIAVLSTILGGAVAVVEHPLTLGTAFHGSCPLLTTHVLSATRQATMALPLLAWGKLFSAPYTGLGVMFFLTGHDNPSPQLVAPRRRHSPN